VPVPPSLPPCDNFLHVSSAYPTQVKSTVKRNLLHQGYRITKHGEGLVVIGLKLREP